MKTHKVHKSYSGYQLFGLRVNGTKYPALGAGPNKWPSVYKSLKRLILEASKSGINIDQIQL